MRIYTINLPPPFTAPDRAPEVVRDGFSIGAFLFTGIWALWQGMWVRAIFLFVLGGVLAGMAAFFGLDVFGQSLVSLAFMAWVGMEANDWHRGYYAKRGWREAGPVAAANSNGALRRFGDLMALDLEIA